MIDDNGPWQQSQTQLYNDLLYEDETKDEVEGGGLMDGYEISQNVDTPYSTPALLGIMREISAPIHHFFKDDDYLK